ncbi:MAG: SIS domain-containing protein [Desulfovibrionaceae bacterium]
MTTPLRDPASARPGPDQVETWLAVARKVLDIEIEGLAAVRDGLDGGFSRGLALLAACEGRVVVSGVGKSGLVGRKIAATLSSTGTPAYFLHPVEGAHGDLGMIRPGDVVLAISNSGETDELNNLLPALQSLGARVVGLTGRADSTLGRLSDVCIPAAVPREACPLGLAPTASTTAALAVGDALAVCLMQIKGFEQRDFRRVHPGGSLGHRLNLFVEDIMHAEGVPATDAAASLAEALAVLNRGGFGLVVLTDAGGRPVGVLTDGDVRRLVCRGPFDPGLPVREVMTRAPRFVRVGDAAAQVLDLMEQHQITVLPVVGEGGALCGVVHLHDVLGKGQLKFSRPPADPGAPGGA